MAPPMVGHQYILHCSKTAQVIYTLGSTYYFYLVFILASLGFLIITYNLNIHGQGGQRKKKCDFPTCFPEQK